MSQETQNEKRVLSVFEFTEFATPKDPTHKYHGKKLEFTELRPNLPGTNPRAEYRADGDKVCLFSPDKLIPWHEFCADPEIKEQVDEGIDKLIGLELKQGQLLEFSDCPEFSDSEILRYVATYEESGSKPFVSVDLNENPEMFKYARRPHAVFYKGESLYARQSDIDLLIEINKII